MKNDKTRFLRSVTSLLVALTLLCSVFVVSGFAADKDSIKRKISRAAVASIAKTVYVQGGLTEDGPTKTITAQDFLPNEPTYEGAKFTSLHGSDEDGMVDVINIYGSYDSATHEYIYCDTSHASKSYTEILTFTVELKDGSTLELKLTFVVVDQIPPEPGPSGSSSPSPDPSGPIEKRIYIEAGLDEDGPNKTITAADCLPNEPKYEGAKLTSLLGADEDGTVDTLTIYGSYDPNSHSYTYCVQSFVTEESSEVLTFTVELKDGSTIDLKVDFFAVYEIPPEPGPSGSPDPVPSTGPAPIPLPSSAPTKRAVLPMPGITDSEEVDVDSSGAAKADILESHIDNSIAAAKQLAELKGVNAGEIHSIINIAVDPLKNPTKLTASLTKNVQKKAINSGIAALTLDLKKAGIAVTMNSIALKELDKQAKDTVVISAERLKSIKLSESAAKIIDNRPIFDLNITHDGNKQLPDLKKGLISVAVPYNLQKDEIGSNLIVVSIDDEGNATPVIGSMYDGDDKVIRFYTNRPLTFGVAYQDNVNFSDINNSWAKNEIDIIAERGIIAGKTSSTFAPDENISRADFIVALGKLADVDVSAYTENKLSDVKADASYAPYANWAVENGIMPGLQKDTFEPQAGIKRYQVADIIIQYANVVGHNLPKARMETSFADAYNIPSSVKDSIAKMYEAGVLVSKDSNRFDPTAMLTKAEAASVIHRYMEILMNYNAAQGWAKNDSGSSMFYEYGKLLLGANIIDGKVYTFNSFGEIMR